MDVESNNVAGTRQIAARVARIAERGDVYGLVGGLGAGKTEFVRGFVEALAPGTIVRSPTFALVYTYLTPRFPIHHFDFYRLEDPAELIEIGFDEYLAGEGVCLIEWADMFPEVLPANTRLIRFVEKGLDNRVIDLGDLKP
ncbi:MAG: tRNA (adenosine(37)-N6)-threonylcarbamoyltransferase complex ATPase subunit type 1 TsaE [Chitinivibrionales bacterium]|nr:tRNA (adenosine(37)-N6)-threonylcarbamoyltransferase complex ATPase subunit type 1 TsaE [Chitinivibrionales bacterium]MBD3357365.1 tRNA (adenosine(37)-N6)-threonylcarbamoyltransferase complex ATPase subunit type 1 TsaE [Chitinivibrionales bacterium]